MSDESSYYRIVGTPHRQTVAPGAKLRFRLEKTGAASGRTQDVPYIWAIRNAEAIGPDDEPVKIGPSQSWIWETSLDRVGKYVVVCTVAMVNDKDDLVSYEYPQWVDPAVAILSREMVQASSQKVPTFEQTALTLARYVGVLRNIETQEPIQDPTKKREYDKKLEHYVKLGTKMLEFKREFSPGYELPSTVGVDALHYAEGSAEVSRLSVGIGYEYRERPGFGGGRWYRVVIADWTNPMDHIGSLFIETWHGPLDDSKTGGPGLDLDYIEMERGKAYDAAIAQWKDDNRYYTGTLSYTIYLGKYQGTIQGSFETTGKKAWDSVSQWLEWIATGAAIIAGVVLLVAPVPGSQIVAAMIWTTILSSTAAAAINIGQRHAEGFGSWSNDAFDILTIVGNLFVVGAMWGKGATLVARGAGGAITKSALIGDIGTNYVQGVLMAQEYVSEYDEIMGAAGLDPDERARKLMALFARAALGAGLLYVNVKASASDLASLSATPKHLPSIGEARPPREKLAELRDPSKEVEIGGPPKVEGHTDQGSQKTTVHEGQVRDPSTPRAKPHVFPEPPAPPDRGMRHVDDFHFGEKAKEKGVYLLVRDSNADAVKWVGKTEGDAVFLAKPETMKAKTRKVDPYKGVVGFDPNDARTLSTLSGMEPQMTEAALAASPAEKQARWDRYVKDKIEHYGYQVEGADKQYLVYKPLPNGKKAYYHGDYDLHGVYDQKGNLLNSEQIRGELNAEFGQELILHGAHDEWPDRNNPKMYPNNGPQPPVTAYMPDGSRAHLKTIPEMKQFYLEHGLDWNGYP